MVGHAACFDNRAMKGTSVRTRVLLVVAFALLVAPGISGCASQPGAMASWAAAPAATGATLHEPGMSEAMEVAWASRPAYARAAGRTEEAYAYAAAHPEVLRWMPCYCGCVAMDHRSNLDCFFRRTESPTTFEEHASYCGVCVDTALMAKQLSAQGQSLRAIRDAIDRSFGGGAPGTNTALPPA
jgi:hypothetical protein